MEFNSFEFLIFFPAFFFLYWFVFKNNIRNQNLLIIAGSYLFFAWWDWRFLFLLVGTTLFNFLLGILISRTENEKKRRLFVLTGIIQGVGLLLFYKYFDFFIISFRDALQSIHINADWHTLNLILPLGISYYTFKTISYILDVDSGKIDVVDDWVTFFAYIAFFPSLLSGPIDKARTFVPQLEKKRVFDHDEALNGLGQILWGLFKKLVIANNCAAITSGNIDQYNTLSGSTLLIGAMLSIIQVYADFSGYSDMAIGIGRLLGFKLTRNFNYPFFAKNIADFWQRWHISLTSWMTEYVFTPLSFTFRSMGNWGLIIAITVNFLLVGLWHGANWTYVLFGLVNGCYFIPLIIRGNFNKKKNLNGESTKSYFINIFSRLGTFLMVTLSTIIINSQSISQAFNYYGRMFSSSLLSIPVIPSNRLDTVITLVLVLLMFIIEWLGRHEEYPFDKLALDKPKVVKWAFLYCLALFIFLFASKGAQFIYFQF